MEIYDTLYYWNESKAAWAMIWINHWFSLWDFKYTHIWFRWYTQMEQYCNHWHCFSSHRHKYYLLYLVPPSQQYWAQSSSAIACIAFESENLIDFRQLPICRPLPPPPLLQEMKMKYYCVLADAKLLVLHQVKP